MYELLELRILLIPLSLSDSSNQYNWMEIGKRRTTIGDLRNDIMVEILCSLPLISIIWCLNVCKLWRDLLTWGPLFLANTINVAAISYNHQYHSYMFLERGQVGGMQFLELDFSIAFPHKRRYSYQILISCNGLLFHVIPGMADLEELYISKGLMFTLPQRRHLINSRSTHQIKRGGNKLKGPPNNIFVGVC